MQLVINRWTIKENSLKMVYFIPSTLLQYDIFQWLCLTESAPTTLVQQYHSMITIAIWLPGNVITLTIQCSSSIYQERYKSTLWSAVWYVITQWYRTTSILQIFLYIHLYNLPPICQICQFYLFLEKLDWQFKKNSKGTNCVHSIMLADLSWLHEDLPFSSWKISFWQQRWIRYFVFDFSMRFWCDLLNPTTKKFNWEL